MGKNSNAATQIALGLALGGLQGFAQAKKEKKAEAREDEKFSLYKQLHELEIARSKTQGNILDMEYSRAKAMGMVFTPEQEAEFKKNKMALEARTADAEAKLKEFDVQNMDEDRSLKLREQNARIGAMERSGRGGGGGGGGAGGLDGLSIAQTRRLGTIKDMMKSIKETYYNEDTGEWKDEKFYNQYVKLNDEFLKEAAKAAGIPNDSAAPAPEAVTPAPATSVTPAPTSDQGGLFKGFGFSLPQRFKSMLGIQTNEDRLQEMRNATEPSFQLPNNIEFTDISPTNLPTTANTNRNEVVLNDAVKSALNQKYVFADGTDADVSQWTPDRIAREEAAGNIKKTRKQPAFAGFGGTSAPYMR